MGSRSGGPTSRSWGPRSGGSTTCKDENWAPGINHRLGEWVQITPVFLAGNRDDVVRLASSGYLHTWPDTAHSEHKGLFPSHFA